MPPFHAQNSPYGRPWAPHIPHRNNPVRVGIVKKAGVYRWSSAREHGKGSSDGAWCPKDAVAEGDQRWEEISAGGGRGKPGVPSQKFMKDTLEPRAEARGGKGSACRKGF